MVPQASKEQGPYLRVVWGGGWRYVDFELEVGGLEASSSPPQTVLAFSS